MLNFKLTATITVLKFYLIIVQCSRDKSATSHIDAFNYEHHTSFTIEFLYFWLFVVDLIIVFAHAFHNEITHFFTDTLSRQALILLCELSFVSLMLNHFTTRTVTSCWRFFSKLRWTIVILSQHNVNETWFAAKFKIYHIMPKLYRFFFCRCCLNVHLS